MNLLYALIAFSIVMIVMTTLVVALVNLIYETRGMRKRHLRYFLGAVFDEYLWPEFGRTVAKIEQKTVRSDSTARDAMSELKPGRSNWAKFAATLDLWTIFRRMLLGRTSGEEAHGFENSELSTGLIVLVWVAITLVIYVCLTFNFLLPILLMAVLIFFLVDQVREIDRESFALWQGVDATTAQHIKRLDQLHDLQAKQIDEASSLSETQKEELETLQEDKALQDPKLLDLHARITRRRIFIDELIKSSKSIAANSARAAKTNQSKLSVIDFAAHLGRTEFGEAIRRTAQNQKEDALDEAAKTLNRMIDEMARRFDGIGVQGSENFREIARRWSIGMAMIVAVIANVDAVRLFTGFYENPELSLRVEAAYEARVEELSKKEAELVEQIAEKRVASEAAADEAATAEAQAEAVGTSAADTDANAKRVAADRAEAELAAFRNELQVYLSEVEQTTSELESLGVPIGWNYFPFCQDLSGVKLVDLEISSTGVNPIVTFDADIVDSRCEALAVSQVLSKLSKTGSDDAQNGQGTTALAATDEAQDATQNESANPSTTVADTGDDISVAVTFADILAQKQNSTVQTTSSAGIDCVLTFGSEGCQTDFLNYFSAAWDWLSMRWSFGMSGWILGVLIGGVLIGLGGPFWFDLYRRLSTLGQITRAAGLSATQKTQETSSAPVIPEAAHKPVDVKDAFNTALETQQQINKVTDDDSAFEALAALVEKADESQEVPVDVKRPPLPLNPDGSVA